MICGVWRYFAYRFYVVIIGHCHYLAALAPLGLGALVSQCHFHFVKATNILWKLLVILAITVSSELRHPSNWPFHFIVGFDLKKENAMSKTLRDACRASLDAAGKTYHY